MMTELPLLPYAGTSGWSGSETSMERAYRDDHNDTTRDRQSAALHSLDRRGSDGITWKELADAKGWHHGQASSVLSVLHLEGRIARLTERRDKCQIYVLPEHVDGREVKAHGRKRPTLDDAELDILDRLERAIALAETEGADRVHVPVAAARAVAAAMRRLS